MLLNQYVQAQAHKPQIKHHEQPTHDGMWKHTIEFNEQVFEKMARRKNLAKEQCCQAVLASISGNRLSANAESLQRPITGQLQSPPIQVGNGDSALVESLFESKQQQQSVQEKTDRASAQAEALRMTKDEFYKFLSKHGLLAPTLTSIQIHGRRYCIAAHPMFSPLYQNKIGVLVKEEDTKVSAQAETLYHQLYTRRHQLFSRAKCLFVNDGDDENKKQTQNALQPSLETTAIYSNPSLLLPPLSSIFLSSQQQQTRAALFGRCLTWDEFVRDSQIHVNELQAEKKIEMPVQLQSPIQARNRDSAPAESLETFGCEIVYTNDLEVVVNWINLYIKSSSMIGVDCEAMDQGRVLACIQLAVNNHCLVYHVTKKKKEEKNRLREVLESSSYRKFFFAAHNDVQWLQDYFPDLHLANIVDLATVLPAYGFCPQAGLDRILSVFVHPQATAHMPDAQRHDWSQTLAATAIRYAAADAYFVINLALTPEFEALRDPCYDPTTGLFTQDFR